MAGLDPGSILQALTALGAKLAYSVILAAIALVCLSELFKVWADRSQILAVFEYNRDGAQVEADGRAFTQRLLQQQALLHRLLQPSREASGNGAPSRNGQAPAQDSGAARLELASLQLPPLQLPELQGSGLEQLQIEVQGLKITDILSRLRNWIRQPGEIRGRIDQVGDEYHVFAQWPSSTGGPQFYNRVATDLQGASFHLASSLLWQQIEEHGGTRSALVQSMIDSFSADQFAQFVAAWMVYRRHAERTEAGGRPEQLDSAIADLDRLMANEPPFPEVYNLAANLRLLRTRPEEMSDTDRARVRGLLATYLDRLAALDLENATARQQLAALEPASRAAARVAVAAASRAEPAQQQQQQQQAVAPGRRPPLQVALAGASISPLGVQTAASACCVVQDRAGRRYLVTAAYLFAQGGDIVVSPAQIDGDAQRIGRLERRYPEGDQATIALIRLDDDVVGANEIPNIGTFTTLGEVPAEGIVRLYGRSSQLREGQILSGTPPPMPGLVAAERISEPGDGGAPVLDQAGRLVGMVYAGSQQVTGILPLAALFDELGLTLLPEPQQAEARPTE